MISKEDKIPERCGVCENYYTMRNPVTDEKYYNCLESDKMDITNGYYNKTNPNCPLKLINQQPQLESTVEEALNKLLINYYNRNEDYVGDVEDAADTIRRAFANMQQELELTRERLIYFKKISPQVKLDKIDEILNRKFSISRRLEDIQRELDDSIK